MQHEADLVVVGAGVMGQAIMRGVLAAGLFSSRQIIAVDPDGQKLARLVQELGVQGTSSLEEAIPQGKIVLLAVKPGVLREIIPRLGQLIHRDQLVISIAAGIPTSFLERYLPEGTPVIRVMPNAPAQVGAGAAVICRGKHAGPEEAATALKLFGAVGRAFELPEDDLDAVTGLSGSGPAYVYLVIEALADGGVRMGLPREVALKLAAQTVLGAATMVLKTGQHPAVLKDQVATPGGTTIEGLTVLERQGVRGAFLEAVTAATRRSQELARLLLANRGDGGC